MKANLKFTSKEKQQVVKSVSQSKETQKSLNFRQQKILKILSSYALTCHVCMHVYKDALRKAKKKEEKISNFKFHIQQNLTHFSSLFKLYIFTIGFYLCAVFYKCIFLLYLLSTSYSHFYRFLFIYYV